MNQEKIGKFIFKLRNEKKMTQQELANKIGVTDRAISNWENGRRMPDLSLLSPLCKELGISINDLLSGEKVNEKDYQEKLEENIIRTINVINKKSMKKIIKKLLILFLIILLGLIIILSSFFITLEYIQKPIYFKKNDLNIIICNYDENHIGFQIKNKDGLGSNIDLKNYDNVIKVKAFRYLIETKNNDLLNGVGDSVILLEKSTKEIYYDNQLIWKNENNLKQCNF